MNSSPPSRARNPGPGGGAQPPAMCCSTRSPKLCPRVSLMDLKLSTSTNSSASRCRARRARATLEARSEFAPVGQLRERIVVRQIVQLVRALGDVLLELAWWARSSASTKVMRAAMVLKESASSSISAEPPRRARAARSPALNSRVAVVSRRTGRLMLRVRSTETRSSTASTAPAVSRRVCSASSAAAAARPAACQPRSAGSCSCCCTPAMSAALSSNRRCHSGPLRAS